MRESGLTELGVWVVVIARQVGRRRKDESGNGACVLGTGVSVQPKLE